MNKTKLTKLDLSEGPGLQQMQKCLWKCFEAREVKMIMTWPSSLGPWASLKTGMILK